jgi:methylmalonyl-CoA mutase C-terminal domain/subunit
MPLSSEAEGNPAGAGRIRVLLAKPGLDGHSRGIQLVAKSLRDAGMEVIYIGMRVSPGYIVETAVQEDVDVIGLSIFSGGLMTVIPRVCRAIQESEAASVPVIVGGIVPQEDINILKEIGVSEVFGPGSDPQEIIDCIERLAAANDRD